ncbi:hypothetical protein PVAP13_9KG488526 [Panicum virgatum]|uniref:Uncharacterized protein n=1 Tax=Panicum virgatum TaxID=38727 RepID=A0A8T0NTI8_PANVG|nr:hypothetical protein PVAP13_9KG488526 [Panicum virgatum]
MQTLLNTSQIRSSLPLCVLADRSDAAAHGELRPEMHRKSLWFQSTEQIEKKKTTPNANSPLQFVNFIWTSMAWKSLLKSYRYCDATSCNFRQGIFPPSDTASQGRWRKMLKLAICGCCRTREVCKVCGRMTNKA